MTLQSVVTILNLAYDIKLSFKILIKAIPAVIISSLLTTVLNQELTFSILTGFTVMAIYNFMLIKLLRSMPRSFTYGEGCIVAQGLIVFLYNCFLQLPYLSTATLLREQLNIILQLGLLSVLFLILVTYFVPFLRNWILFYSMLIFICMTLCFTTINNKYAVQILWNFIFKDFERSLIVGAYIIFVMLAILTVALQIQRNKKSSTATRKIFHILIVMVFVPGLLYQCNFLYIATVIIFAFLIVLELARVINLYPVADILDTSVLTFIDEKDAGNVALTPLYLLIGCSLPMWIHNSPCDLIDSCSFEFLPLLAGIISIGIGDTLASVIGSNFGRHKWGKLSKKSVEGTLASITGQFIFIYGLNYFDLLYLNPRLTTLCGIAVISNALIEAFTDQVDNLVLPIITYTILAFKWGYQKLNSE